MNYVDILLLLLILVSLWQGIQNGFISTTLDVIGWVGGLLLSFMFYPYAAQYAEKHFDMGVWTIPLSFLITFLVIRLLIGIVLHAISTAVPRHIHHHPVNRGLGLLPGAFNGLVWAAIIAAIIMMIPLWDGLPERARESKVASRLTDQLERLETRISPELDKAINRTITNLTVEPGSDRNVKLPYTTTRVKVRHDLEAEMLEMINEERAARNLVPLKSDPELAIVARRHSADMFARGYFSHITPEGKDPFYRMRKNGVRFLTAGENLALAPTLRIAHRGLMNSPGHRANILSSTFGRVGRGILEGGVHGLMITQNFRN